jgi:hypothetical protein
VIPFAETFARGDTFGRDFHAERVNTLSRQFIFGRHFIKVSPLIMNVMQRLRRNNLKIDASRDTFRRDLRQR